MTDNIEEQDSDKTSGRKLGLEITNAKQPDNADSATEPENEQASTSEEQKKDDQKPSAEQEPDNLPEEELGSPPEAKDQISYTEAVEPVEPEKPEDQPEPAYKSSQTIEDPLVVAALSGGSTVSTTWFSMVLSVAALIVVSGIFYIYHMDTTRRIEKMESDLANYTVMAARAVELNSRSDVTMVRAELGRSISILDKVISLNEPDLTVEAIKLRAELLMISADLAKPVAIPIPTAPVDQPEDSSAEEPSPAIEDTVEPVEEEPVSASENSDEIEPQPAEIQPESESFQPEDNISDDESAVENNTDSLEASE